MSVIRRTLQAEWQLRVFFTEDVFDADNRTLLTALGDACLHKMLVVVDESLAKAQPDLVRRMEAFFSGHSNFLRPVAPPVLIAGGEPAKNSCEAVAGIHSLIDRYHLDRHSYLLAVGGGAMLDVAGLAAATAHRGVRHIRIPSTTLAQADSGVGVKNGINAFGKKNFIGTFAPPHAVINDFNLLTTLEPRDKRAGYVEAVKIACIRDGEFFDEIERAASQLAAFEPATMKRLIHRCAGLHLDHIAGGGDPFETGSARPLDFGHWAAHKLEQLSNFQIRHGEAVAIGIALDVVYARIIGLLDEPGAGRILDLLERLGFNLFAEELLTPDRAGQLRLLEGLEEFREHLGGDLNIPLLPGIGRIVEVHEMDLPRVVEAVHALQERHADRAPKTKHIPA